jgi:hypothetical protein
MSNHPNAGWAVFENKTDPSIRYLYHLGLSTTAPITSIRTIDPALNFNNASIYATNKTAVATQMLYGAVGDRLYMYNTGDNTERLLTLEGMESGREITMVTHKPGIRNPSLPPIPAPAAPANGYLIIATYNAGAYRVYVYDVTGGVPDGPPVAVYSGTGRVVDMQYTGGTTAYSQIL